MDGPNPPTWPKLAPHRRQAAQRTSLKWPKPTELAKAGSAPPSSGPAHQLQVAQTHRPGQSWLRPAVKRPSAPASSGPNSPTWPKRAPPRRQAAQRTSFKGPKPAELAKAAS